MEGWELLDAYERELGERFGEVEVTGGASKSRESGSSSSLHLPSFSFFVIHSKIDLRSKLKYCFTKDLLKVFAWVDKNTKTACRMEEVINSTSRWEMKLM